MPFISIFNDAFILTGPTASGKSSIALPLAERLDAEILCMDSMTLYRRMDIGTAKPTAEDRQRVPHHLVDVLDPWEGASVAWWLEQATRAAHAIRNRGKRILVVGGTPLYLKALLCGLFSGPDADPQLRAELEALPNEVLLERLRAVDPQSAARIHLNDQKRLVRALEVFLLTRQPISTKQDQFNRQVTRRYPPLWLDWPRDLLYQRIERRIEQMLDAGWLDEVKQLGLLPEPLSKEAGQAAGYREFRDHFQGKLSLEEAITAAKTRSRQLAKRQLTWLRNFPGLHAIPVTGKENSTELAELCWRAWFGNAMSHLA